MNTQPTPLTNESPVEVALPQTPLVRVIHQIRFPPILSILKAEVVADFQEELRAMYPHLHKEDVENIEIRRSLEPSIADTVIWRLADQQETASWRVSLGVDFVSLETHDYRGRQDFLSRLRAVLYSVEKYFRPTETQRVGLRYIDQLKGEAVRRIDKLIRPSVLGILQPEGEAPDSLRLATIHMLTRAQFMAEEGVIQGQWGNLPPNSTFDPEVLQTIEEPSWVLDLDMYSTRTEAFKTDELVGQTNRFANRIYTLFRLMVTDEFLRFYGGAL